MERKKRMRWKEGRRMYCRRRDWARSTGLKNLFVFISTAGSGKLQMDTSFALRGLAETATSSGRSPQRKLPAEPKLPLRDISVQRFLAGGSRAFHGSGAVSDSFKVAYVNRPLSPHLQLKKPQLSATYSISHRIFGVGVVGGILLFPLAMKFSTLFDI
ncbi:Succinate dehydrogenase cytochrome b560 subunit [Platanthera zijinensis]|uniref:Succinate dehydrogenase cytochrome b560 subunit n=1 Tax=Platanthera zijinensis TaxID=2320716 RepID=A0AAP0BK89_9ASPA